MSIPPDPPISPGVRKVQRDWLRAEEEACLQERKVPDDSKSIKQLPDAAVAVDNTVVAAVCSSSSAHLEMESHAPDAPPACPSKHHLACPMSLVVEVGRDLPSTPPKAVARLRRANLPGSPNRRSLNADPTLTFLNQAKENELVESHIIHGKPAFNVAEHGLTGPASFSIGDPPILEAELPELARARAESSNNTELSDVDVLDIITEMEGEFRVRRNSPLASMRQRRPFTTTAAGASEEGSLKASERLTEGEAQKVPSLGSPVEHAGEEFLMTQQLAKLQKTAQVVGGDKPMSFLEQWERRRRGHSFNRHLRKDISRKSMAQEHSHIKKTFGQYESYAYDKAGSRLHLAHDMHKGEREQLMEMVSKWVVTVLVGLILGCIACAMTAADTVLIAWKWSVTQPLLDSGESAVSAWAAYVGLCCSLVLLAALLTYAVPPAGGSGLPQMKAYLNGSRIPGMLWIQTLFVKVVGIVLCVAAGLPVGREGPMVHTGGIVAAGVARGRLKLKGTLLPHSFDSDRERRDFVSMGCAAGVAAAFNTPVGGILYAMEEVATHWNHHLTWHSFFSALVAALLVNSFLSGYRGTYVDEGLVMFGEEHHSNFQMWEIPLFASVGVVGGLFGALFCFLNLQRPFPDTPPPEGLIGVGSILLFLAVYSAAAVLVFGCAIPAGNFVPAMTMGATFGRLLGQAFHSVWGVEPGSYALLGAASMLTGVTRMTVSLCVILVEVTNDVQSALAMMISIAVARVVADSIHPSYDDALMKLAHLPYLEPHVPEEFELMVAKDVMTKDVVVLEEVEKVGAVLAVLRQTAHNGFPIVDTGKTGRYAFFCGMITRQQLLLLLAKKAYGMPCESGRDGRYSPITNPSPSGELRAGFDPLDWARDSYYGITYAQMMQTEQSKMKVTDLDVADADLNKTVDLRPFMDPSPYTVNELLPLGRVYPLFTLIGVRHLAVVDCQEQVVGMITRKDVMPEIMEATLISDETEVRDAMKLFPPDQARAEQRKSAAESAGSGRSDSPSPAARVNRHFSPSSNRDKQLEV